jgi:hypothetical protein
MTMHKDMDQASKMRNMRIKIDVWTKGLDESFREKVRENLQDLFWQLPARRVWYYLKRIRFMLLNGNGLDGTVGLQLASDHLVEGPEDVIVKGKYHLMNPPLLFRS